MRSFTSSLSMQGLPQQPPAYWGRRRGNLCPAQHPTGRCCISVEQGAEEGKDQNTTCRIMAGYCIGTSDWLLDNGNTTHVISPRCLPQMHLPPLVCTEHVRTPRLGMGRLMLLPPTPADLQAMMTTIATMTIMSRACMHLCGHMGPKHSSSVLLHALLWLFLLKGRARGQKRRAGQWRRRG